jgi:hypothetical protein
MVTFGVQKPQPRGPACRRWVADMAHMNANSSDLPNRCHLCCLWSPVDIGPLVFFRIFFGGVMLHHVYSLWTDGGIAYFYMRPDVHFTYPGFGWVQPWPDYWMPIHFLVMGFAAAGVALGLYYRLSAAVLCLTFTHAFLMEKALYQNHFYLMCLVSFLMIFLPCHRAFSLDAWRRPSIRSPVAPAWCLWLLRIQVAIPYFYGGLAKLNSDWLQGMPMRLWLARHQEAPHVGPYLTEDWVVYFFAYGGLLFDLLIVPLLLWRRTRVFAYVLALAFHLTNAVLFDIGIFPWFMIGATLLFFDPNWVRKCLRLPALPEAMRRPASETLSARQRATVALLSIYLAWQVLFPFRHFLYPGDPSWTEEGHFFAWHMLLREKNAAIRFYVRNPLTGKRGIVQVSSFLNYRQLSRMSRDADMILQFVHYIRDHYREHGQDGLEIYVLNLVSLNGRKPQLMMDPRVNYAKAKRKLFSPQPWIVPLEEPLRPDGWNLPVEKWEEALAVDLPPEIFGYTQTRRLESER